jgi:hypothetical protein
MTNEQLKPIIDEILTDYFNMRTRLNYDRKIQSDMVAQNRGLTNACSSVIIFSDNQQELVEYTKAKIEEINQGEAQEVRIK